MDGPNPTLRQRRLPPKYVTVERALAFPPRWRQILATAPHAGPACGNVPRSLPRERSGLWLLVCCVARPVLLLVSLPAELRKADPGKYEHWPQRTPQYRPDATANTATPMPKRTNTIPFISTRTQLGLTSWSSASLKLGLSPSPLPKAQPGPGFRNVAWLAQSGARPSASRSTLGVASVPCAWAPGAI